MDELLLRRRMLNNFRDEYIVFADPVVEQLCANNWGDGIGLTKKDAAKVTTVSTVFRGNTDITSFDEFKYFTNVSAITGGSSTSNLGAFGGCTNLTSITLPESIRTINNYAFYNCSNLTGDFIFDSSVTIGSNAFQYTKINKVVFRNHPSVQGNAFQNITTLREFTFENSSNIPNTLIHRVGGGSIDSAFSTNGNVTKSGANSYYLGWFRRYYIGGNLIQPKAGPIFGYANNREVHVAGNINCTNTSRATLINSANSKLIFIEVGGVINNAGAIIGGTGTNCCANGFIWHFAKTDGIACSPTIASVSNSRVSKVYVGDGSSQAADQAVLDMYLADPDWAQDSSKLDLWYNYTGEFKNS